MHKQSPEIRFKGFTDDWEQHKLGDFSDVTKLAGFEFTKYVEYSDSGKIIALRGLNVKNGNLVLDDVKYIDESDFSKLNRSKLFKNDLLLTYVGTVGQLAIIPEDDRYYLAPNVARIRIDNQNDPMFISQQMTNESFYNRIIIPLIATSSQPALSMENVRKFELQLPNIEEQKKIGAFFKSLDDTIALHQDAIQRQQDLKKALLQKLFPVNGERIPTVRFATFKEEWEQLKLGELAEVKTGKAFSSADFNDEGEYLVVTNKNIQDDTNGITSVGDRIDISEETILNNYLLNGNNVLVTMDGVNIGKTGKYSNEKAILAQRVGRLNSEQIEFIYQVTKNNKFLTEMNKLSVGNAIKHISLKQISDYSFAAPINKEEQRKIGAFFKQLDDAIALHQDAIRKLQLLKQSLLQKMFVN